MRSDHEWSLLLGRQADLLDAATDYLYACRESETGVSDARAMFDQALQIYRATLEVAPLHVVGQFARRRGRS